MQSEGLWIESALFQPEPGEDAETNPGVFGKKFAEWIATSLRGSGYTTEVVPEDWGWCVVCARKPFLLWVGCGNVVQEHGDSGASDTSVVNTWHCFTVAEIPFWKRLFGRIDPSRAISKLEAQIKANLVAEPGIKLVAEP